MLANVRINIKKFIFVQVIVLFVGTIITQCIYNFEYSLSYFIGGLVLFIANFIFFARLLVKKSYSPVTELLIFYLSEFIKLGFVAIITVLLAIYLKPKLFAYIFGLISLQLLVFFVPLFMKKIR